MGGQLQLRRPAGDEAPVPLAGPLPPAENDVVKGVDGVLRRGLAVGGRICHHVAAHHNGHLPARESPAQGGEVVRVGDVDREVLREDMDMELVRCGDGGDAAADAVGLGLLRPGELVNSQHDLIAQIPDGLDNALMGEGEGVEGAGEEGHGPGRVEVETAVENLLLGEETVDPPQHSRPVVEGQLRALVLPDEGQQLFQRQQEGPPLLMAAQDL